MALFKYLILRVGRYKNVRCVCNNMDLNSKCIFPFHNNLLLDFLLIVKAAPHECVNRTSQP